MFLLFLADLQDKFGSTLTLNINIEETLTATEKNRKIIYTVVNVLNIYIH
jgi:hypothetical protein